MQVGADNNASNCITKTRNSDELINGEEHS